MIRQSVIFLGLLGLSGCANASADEGNFTQARADAIIEKCEAPKGILWVENDGVRFEPPSDLSYDVSMCVLNEIKASGVTKIGFVGNEKLAEPEDQ